MYTNKESGMTVYETLDELLNCDIKFVSEYNGYYFIKLQPYCYYDNSIWRINKATGEVSYMMFTQYLCDGIANKATSINIEKIKNERVKKSS